MTPSGRGRPATLGGRERRARRTRAQPLDGGYAAPMGAAVRRYGLRAHPIDGRGPWSTHQRWTRRASLRRRSRTSTETVLNRHVRARRAVAVRVCTRGLFRYQRSKYMALRRRGLSGGGPVTCDAGVA
mmetsp:Transcript_30376/g.99462  ORF Transcript_30376/g.99462 Transcript_30376/m.99462 type:complete len:128 (-) Transcript_30376:20-403(-)